MLNIPELKGPEVDCPADALLYGRMSAAAQPSRSVFLSYSRADAAAIVQVEERLLSDGFALWRDQASLYGGDRWPVRLGDAIASSSALLLIWSAGASSSEWVEFEWSTAVALRKRVVILQLDETPLPPALAGVHVLGPQSLDQLTTSLRFAATARDAPPRGAVLKGLDALDSATPERALQAVRPFLGPRVSRAKVLIPAAMVLLTAGAGYASFCHGTRALRLDGTVYAETGAALPGVVVALPELGFETRTNRFGRFAFTVPGARRGNVKLVASKPCYQPRNFDPMLGNGNFEFKMIRDKRCPF